MGKSGAQITGRIDCEAGSTTKAYANGDNQQAYHQWMQSLREVVCADKKKCKDQYCRCDDFTEEI